MAHFVAFDHPGAPVHLGEPISVYRQGISSRLLLAIRLLVCLALVIGVGSLYFGLFYLWRGLYFDLFRNSPSFRMTEDLGLYALFLLVLLVVLLGLTASVLLVVRLTLHPYFDEWRDLAAIYPQGIGYFHHGAWYALRWNEISRVTREKKPMDWSGVDWSGWLEHLGLTLLGDLVIGDIRQYAICAVGRDPIQIGGTLSRVEQLMDTIEQYTSRAREADVRGYHMR